VQSLVEKIKHISSILEIDDQIDNFSEIIKSLDLDLISETRNNLLEVVKTQIHATNLKKEEIRYEEIQVQNEHLKLQSEYSTKRIDHESVSA
jgi:hypothetical protein